MHEPTVILVPQQNPNDDSAVLVCWHVESGARVAADQAIATLETSKSAFDVHAPGEGYVFFELPPKTMVAVGAPLAWIGDEPMTSRPQPPAEQPEAATDTSAAHISRKALRLMREHGLTAADFGTQRVEVADVEKVIRDRSRRPAVQESDAAEPLEQSPAKLLEVRLLGEVYETAVPSTVAVALSVEKVDARLRRLAEAMGPISLLELAIHSAARLLADFPELNGFHAGDKAWKYRAAAIGFAINLGRSLRVPVVRDAANDSPLQVARKVRDLSMRYLRDELAMEDLTGGTFTVTDLSAYSVVHFVPVINHRQSAIVGICSERPGTGHRDLVLTFDHRMADGMQAAQFLAALRAQLEEESGHMTK